MKENKKKQDVPPNVQFERFKRGIFLPSEITEQTYGQLAPKIIELRQGNEPICLYIHCYGGIPSEAEQIMRLIRAPKQDGSKCGVTTICIGVAASAAADMLSAGDYAIAYNDAIIHVHGTRGTNKEVTMDNLPQLEASLREENEYFAMKLASRMFRRFATQALLMEAFKESPPMPNVIGVAANPKGILSVIAANVAPEHKALVQSAIDRVDRITNLFEYIKQIFKGDKTDQINTDSDLLKMIVDFEATDLLNRRNKGGSY